MTLQSWAEANFAEVEVLGPLAMTYARHDAREQCLPRTSEYGMDARSIEESVRLSSGDSGPEVGELYHRNQSILTKVEHFASL